MPSRCCVPGCRSNYDSLKNTCGSVSVFTFPTDPERRQRWLRAIHRDNYIVNKNSVVCANHFEERFILKEDRAVRADGSVLIVPRSKPKLSSDAFPTKFENQPKYLSSELPPKRRDPKERAAQIEAHELMNERRKSDRLETNDSIDNFELFRESHKTKKYCSKYSATVINGNDFIIFLQHNLTLPVPEILYSIKIKNNFECEVCYKGCGLQDATILNILGEDGKCDKWTKLDAIFQHVHSFHDCSGKTDKDIINLCLERASEYLQLCISKAEKELDTVKLDKIVFLKEQIRLLLSNVPKYSPHVLVWACTLFYTHPGGYINLRNSRLLTIPHPKYLKSLSEKLDISSADTTNSHIKYIKEKVKYLNDNEKLVNLLLDEIYVKSCLSYKGGKIEGVSGNLPNESATTIQTFMISSIASHNKDVVGLFPVKNLTHEYLFKLTNQMLEILTTAGYNVISIISDNNRVNRKMFEKFSGGVIQSSVENPYSKADRIFLLFDSVHIMKCVRNNWLNQTDNRQTFIIPNINADGENSDSKFYAQISDLKLLYTEEEHSTIKLAPSLSKKVLYPSSTERQNVRYCIKLFDDKNIAALKNKRPSEAAGTIMLLENMLKWWKIVNCRSKYKGDRFRDSFYNPVFSDDNHHLNYLKLFSEWLIKWDGMEVQGETTNKKRHGKLTNETHFAIHHTTQAYADLCNYLFTKHNFTYVLLGKFQTDDLEARFGQYRQMSGANYHISVAQVLESERKLKFISLINLKSSKNGNFQLTDFSINEDDDSIEDVSLDEFFNDVPEIAKSVHISYDEASILIYIAGYIASKILRFVNCNSCKKYIVRDKTMDVNVDQSPVWHYLKINDRGGLKWPHEQIVQIVTFMFTLFQTLLTERFEERFLQCRTHKEFFVKLALSSIDIDYSCNCADATLVIKKTASTFANIILNNYCNVKNDVYNKSTKKRKIEKLSSS